MKEYIPEAADRWAAAVASRDPAKAIELYHPDAVLWGTFSKVIRHGHDSIKEYFVKFLDKEDLRCRFTEGITRDYNEFAFFSGSYEFSYDDKGINIIVPARFSFIYKKEEGKVLIMEHHSSLFPD